MNLLSEKGLTFKERLVGTRRAEYRTALRHIFVPYEGERFQLVNIFQKDTAGCTQETDLLCEICQTGIEVGDPDEHWGEFQSSGFNEIPKWTFNADMCLAVALLGISLEGGPLSGLFHIPPWAFQNIYFDKEYRQHLQEFKRLTTRRIAVVAGGYHKPYNVMKYHDITTMAPWDRRRPKKAAKWLSSLHRNILETTTTVVSPKITYGKTNVFVGANNEVIIIEATQGVKEPSVSNYLLPKTSDWTLYG